MSADVLRCPQNFAFARCGKYHKNRPRYGESIRWSGGLSGWRPGVLAERRLLKTQGLEPHHHDQVGQLVPGPAAQPAHLPIAEAGAQLDGRAKAEEFRFQLHGVDSFGSTHSWLWRRAQSSPEPANRVLVGRVSRSGYRRLFRGHRARLSSVTFAFAMPSGFEPPLNQSSSSRSST